MPSPHLREDLPFSPTDLVLRYSLEQRAGYLRDAFETAAQHWQIEVVAERFDRGDEPVSWPVGWARVTIAARDHGANLYEVFDSIDGDHETVASALFDPSDGDLSEDLEERYPLILGDVLLCDRTWVKPEYRGHRLGLLIKAMSISALGRGCGIAVTYPAPFEGDYDDAERDRAIAALGAHWAEFGFEHFKNGVGARSERDHLPSADGRPVGVAALTLPAHPRRSGRECKVHLCPILVYQRRRGCGWASGSCAIGSSTTWLPPAAART